MRIDAPVPFSIQLNWVWSEPAESREKQLWKNAIPQDDFHGAITLFHYL
ncbi:hypothetical protein [Roseibium sp.]